MIIVILVLAQDVSTHASIERVAPARDVKYLTERGYKLDKVRAVEQFCHSMHVEAVVLLSKGVVDKDNYRKVKVDFSLEDMDLTELRGQSEICSGEGIYT